MSDRRPYRRRVRHRVRRRALGGDCACVLFACMAHMVPIFKAGNHVSRDGRALTFTTSDLDRIVTTYNSQPADSRHDAPVCIGHQANDAPAYGWFSTIKRDGDLLYGELKDPHPDFVQWVKDGRYRKRSAKFDENGLLKHVAWLGAQPPAIKGLPDFTFEEGKGEEYEVEFSEDEINDIEDSTSTSSEAIMPDPNTATPPQPAAPAAGETPPVTVPPQPTAAEFAELEAQLESEKAQRAADRARLQTLEFSEFLNRPNMQLRVTPAMRPTVMNLLKGIDNLGAKGGTFEFAEGVVTVSGDLMTELKKLLEMITEATSTEEVATDGEPQGEEFSEGSPIAAEIDRLAAKATGTTTLNGGAR